jgi:hypothetical protein
LPLNKNFITYFSIIFLPWIKILENVFQIFPEFEFKKNEKI